MTEGQSDGSRNIESQVNVDESAGSRGNPIVIDSGSRENPIVIDEGTGERGNPVVAEKDFGSRENPIVIDDEPVSHSR